MIEKPALNMRVFLSYKIPAIVFHQAIHATLMRYAVS